MENNDSQVKKELTTEEELRCVNCGNIFEEAGEMEEHKEVCHITPYSCNTCLKKETSLQDFEAHLQDHGGFKFFRCIICQQVFKFLWELNHHLPVHMPEEKFIEDFQDEPFEDEKSLMINNEVKEEDVPCTTADYDNTPDSPESEKIQQSTTFTRNVEKRTYMKKQSKIDKTSYTNRKRGRPKKVQKEEEVEERRYQCPNCHHSSKTFSNLKKHIRTHSGVKAFECAICGNCYSDKYALRDHLLMKHVQMKKLNEVCSYCGKAFKLRKGLRVHIRTQHTSKEQYSCFVCGKMYASKNSVDLHIRTHSNQPGGHSCPKCGKNFDRRDLMLQHHRHIHVAPKKFQCTWESCSFQSVTQGAFLLHVRKHTGEKPFRCGICDKLFKSKMAVSLHTINMHKPATIQCGFCEKVFKLPSALRNHVRRIHQERTLPCPFCDKKYGFKADLTRHVRNSHSHKST